MRETCFEDKIQSTGAGHNQKLFTLTTCQTGRIVTYCALGLGRVIFRCKAVDKGQVSLIIRVRFLAGSVRGTSFDPLTYFVLKTVHMKNVGSNSTWGVVTILTTP